MSPSNERTGDDELHAYVDGYLSAEDRLRVEARLAADPEAAERVARWSADTDELRSSLRFRALDEIPDRLRPSRMATSRRGWSQQAVAASVAVALLGGAGIGWLGRGSDVRHGLDGLTQQAALADRVFADPPSNGRVAAEHVEPIVGSDRDHPGQPVEVPDLARSGYTLVSTRAVPTQQGSAAFVTYEGSGGRRVSMLIRLMIGQDVDSPLRQVRADDAAGYAWSHRGLGYSLVSTSTDVDLAGLAQGLEEETGRAG